MAPPVRRDGFSYYEGVFYAHIDNCRHERSNAETLHNLLTYEAPGPTLTKAGKIAKRQPEAHKDPPCHFYRAQLMHYGLPGLKAKQPAKKRLLAAIKDGSDGKTLEVPHDILKLENEMKEEWIKLKEAEVKKRKEEKASEEAAEKARNAERTRAIVQETVREHEEESMDDENESMNDEDESMDEEDKSTDEDDGLTEDEGNESDAIPAYVIETRMGFFSLEKGIAEKLLDDVLNRNQSTEYDLRYGLEKLGVLKKGRMFNFTEYPEGYTGNKRSKPEQKHVKHPTPLNASTNPQGHKRGCESSSLNEQSAQKKQRRGYSDISDLFSGKFKVDAPKVAREWPHLVSSNGQTMEFAPSLTDSHLWGYFNFGPIDGYIRSVGPPTRAGKKLKFKWRGHKRGGEDEMTFAPHNKGSITFSADGMIKGTLKGSVIGKTKFTGWREAGPPGIRGYNPERLRGWKHEFRSINSSAHESENNDRWRTRRYAGNDGSLEGPADSDTTNGEL